MNYNQIDEFIKETKKHVTKYDYDTFSDKIHEMEHESRMCYNLGNIISSNRKQQQALILG